MIFPTINDMWNYFNLQLDKFQAPSFIESEFVDFLNNAILYYQKQCFDQYQIIEKDTDNTRLFVVPVNNQSVVNNQITLPDDYKWMTRVGVNVNYSNCHNVTKSYATRARIRLDSVWDMIQIDPFNQPNYKRVYYEIIGQTLTFYSGSDIVANTSYKYFKMLVPITWDISNGFLGTIPIPQDQQIDLFNIIMKLALENIEQPRLKTFDETPIKV